MSMILRKPCNIFILLINLKLWHIKKISCLLNKVPNLLFFLQSCIICQILAFLLMKETFYPFILYSKLSKNLCIYLLCMILGNTPGSVSCGSNHTYATRYDVMIFHDSELYKKKRTAWWFLNNPEGKQWTFYWTSSTCSILLKLTDEEGSEGLYRTFLNVNVFSWS